MKLAEALILRADYQTRIEQLKQRLYRNAKVQEGEKPTENPVELTQEFEQVAQELTSLIQRINRTNTATVLTDGGTLTDALAVRDVLSTRAEIYRGMASAAVPTVDRYSRTEIKSVSTIDVAATQKQADALAREYRELDARIQAANWATDLLD